jgi:hypothetical protein
MPRKLTDRHVGRLRELAADGRDHAELAAEFGVSARHVGRIVRGDQRQTIAASDGPVATAVRRLLDGLELDDADRVLAASAEVLAARLDAVRVSDSAASAAATPALVRQLADTLREIRGEQEDITATVRRMLEPLRRP